MRVRFLPAKGDPARQIAGLAVAERTRRALAQAAIVESPAQESAPQLLVAADALLEPGAIRVLVDVATDAQLALAPHGGTELPAAIRVPSDTRAPTHADDLAGLAKRFQDQGRLRSVDTGDAVCCRVRSDADARRVEDRMLASLIRPTDGFFARHFDRHLSRRLSVVLVRWGLHPNLVTAAATLVGLVGAALLASVQQPVQVLGALLFVFATILDGCDGEVARLSLRTSKLGGRLDLIGDNIVNGAVFLAIGTASLRVQPTPLLQAAVIATLIGLCLATAAGFWYSTWLSRSGRQEAIRDRYESLVSRDFAYLILALAVLGKLSWFVWAAAVGSHLFALLLVALRLREWPPEPKKVEIRSGEKTPSRVVASAMDGGSGP